MLAAVAEVRKNRVETYGGKNVETPKRKIKTIIIIIILMIAVRYDVKLKSY